MPAPARWTALIPARLASTRFPEKVLAADTGRPMIVHVCEAAARAACVDRVVVAADHERIAKAVRDAGFDAVLTSPEHPNGSSRLAEATTLLGLPDEAFVVNVQGDEPELPPEPIEAAAAMMERNSGSVLAMTTVAAPFTPDEDPDDSNIVKVTLRADGRALYFSRSRIPFERTPGAAPTLKHAGLYASTAGFLRTYAGLAPTPLEQAERLEQLRVLEHGYELGVAVVPFTSHGVDTAEQYQAFVRRYRTS
ncbi:MAG: 3-deoxy-manno-octulosonate cytidylyltransferase [Planctomycetota bacterium]